MLDREHVDLLLNDKGWGLIQFIKKSSAAGNDSLVRLRNGLLCLGQVIRSHNLEIRHWVKGCALLLCEVVNRFKG